MNRLYCVLLKLIYILCVVSCNDEYREKVPNGYELVKNNNWQHQICDGLGNVKIPHNIVKYAVINDYIIGESVIPYDHRYPELSASMAKGAVSGYFILDTKSGVVRLGLEYHNYLNAMRDLHLSVPHDYMSTSSK